MKRRSTFAFNYSGALVSFALLLLGLFAHARSDNPADATLPDDGSVSDAICPIVYPVDETPSERGYQYIFYGNAFFINKQGYLITAAHVLSAFRNGDAGQPYILVNRPHAPAVLQKARLIAADWKHDVAVLRATTNPFQGNFRVTYLSASAQSIVPGDSIQAVALRPSKVQDAHTFQAPLHDRFAAQVMDFQFTQEERGASDTELLLFDHEVLRGQSGAPVISPGTHEVIGIIDGRWLRPAPLAVAKTSSAVATGPTKPASSMGAAVRIHYALALLRHHGIDWEASQSSPAAATAEPDPATSDKNPSIPFPVSVVAAPYPVNALFGGEVVLDVLVSTDGTIADVQVVRCDPPFRAKAEEAVQTWSFRPARVDGRPVQQRIAVVFDFAQPYLPSPVPRGRTYPDPPDSDDRAPLPVYTLEPGYPPDTVAEGTVVVLGKIDAQGQLVSTKVVRGGDPFASAATAAMHQWRFMPGKRAGEAVESAVVVVAAFRRPALTRVNPAPKSQAQQDIPPQIAPSPVQAAPDASQPTFLL